MTDPKLPLAVVPTPSHTEFGSRRRGVIVLVLIAVLLGLAGWFTAAAQSEQAGTVTFVAPDGDPRVFPVLLDSVEPDVKNQQYKVRPRSGKTTTVDVAQGWSLKALADTLPGGLTLTPYPYLAVDRTLSADGDRVLLRKQQIINSNAFPGGLQVIVYKADDGLVHFLRPQAFGKDTNGSDEVALGSNITVRLLKNPPLKLKVTATPSPAKVGQRVTFRVSVDKGQAAGEEFTFSWTLGSHFNDTGPRTSYVFRKRGTYRMALTADPGLDGASSGTGSVYVRVGAKSKAKGPDRTGGGTNTTGGSDSGAADGLSGTGVSLGDYAGADPYADSAATASTDGSVTDPAPVTPEPTPTTAAPAPATTTPKETVPAPAGTTPVEGQLVTNLSLAAATVPAADASPAAESTATPVAARTGTPQTAPKEDGGLHVPAGVWMLLAVVLLLIGGFWQDAYRAVAPRSVPRIP